MTEKNQAQKNSEDEQGAEDTVGDDIFAEFAASMEIPQVQEALREGVDTEKMMGELADLKAMTAHTDGSESALEEDVDTEKMASEATKLSGV